MDENEYMFEGGEPIPERDYFPRCIVWSPIPVLTYLLPCVGHLGIVTTEGEIQDFAGSYYINKSSKRTGFGKITKYWHISPSDIKELNSYTSVDEHNLDPNRAWDLAIHNASCEYRRQTHNLVMNNCHSHVALALNSLKFKSRRNWNTLLLILYMTRYSKFNGFGGFLRTYGGFLVLVLFVVIIVVISKVV